uniref:ATP synthase F0 subunit 8 n=1 Tax=Pseudoglomeris planiuscula TaxID=3036352 RepID=UPI00279D2321|nr:ATP synthase F0 subunit 8 [Pseudoglomeris planiuscula]WGO57538.1 ATP synthase F0 subunit 8 [Pseudoglomeris planiuscula]
MPQMMPMNWLILYMMFILIMLLFSIMNYYLLLNQPKGQAQNIKKKILTWKW